MATASIDQNITRYDAVTKPILTVSGLEGDGWLKFSDWFYIPIVNGENEISILNRTEFDGVLEVRDFSNVLGDTTSTGSLSENEDSELVKTGVGWGGTYLPGELALESTIVQSPAGAVDQINGVGLLDTDLSIDHDYTSDQVPHCILFGLNGIAEIRELGVPLIGFNYLATDMGVIELTDGYTKYYLRHADGSMDLIMSSPTLITGDPLAEAMAYSDNAVIQSLSVNQSTDDVTNEHPYLATGIMMPSIIQGTLSTIGVLYSFQDWRNDFATQSTAEPLQMADNNMEFTFMNIKKRLRSINPNLAMRDKTYRLAVETFFDWHGIEKDFVFVDDAKKDISNVHTYWWARFTAPMGQITRQSCLTAFNTQITETYNTTFIPPPA